MKNYQHRDLTGQRFHFLTVVQRIPAPAGQRGVWWLCRCDCGTETRANPYQLIDGKKFSCGCKRVELNRQAITKHGAFGTPEYTAWAAMRYRCLNPRSAAYADYGGRGITVCDRWESFENFLEDMGLRPTPKHTLDRIDNNGNYEPDNCRWATHVQQGRNTRKTTMLTYDGRTMARGDWAEETGIPATTIQRRLDYGWSVEQALTTPLQPSWIRRRPTE